METLREKEFYRGKIIGIVEEIENLAILEYLCIFIQGKVRGYAGNEKEEI